MKTWHERPSTSAPPDYIVIGGGSAGCVLAEMLSRDPAANITLLEAGPPDTSPLLADPRAWPALIGGEHDAGFATVPQAAAFDRIIPWPRGRVIGGSSSINAMVFMRGAHADFDDWAAQGCVGWGWDAVAPHFEAIEMSEIEGPTRGREGRLRVTVPQSVSPLSAAVHDGAVELGFPELQDVNRDLRVGVGRNQVTIADGRRDSASTAFLRPAIDRPNLTIRTETRATRMVIRGERVVAVEVSSPVGAQVLPLAGRVVLAAGAIESPKLLMLSGVGPADELSRLGIGVCVDSPNVGKNLHDHPGVPITFRARRPVPVGPNQASETFIFASSGSRIAREASARPDLQYGALTVPLDPHGQVAGFDGFSLYPSALKPASRGSVSLRSAADAAPPLIDPGYLSEPSDMAVLRASIDLSRDLASTRALSAWIDTEVWPGTNTRASVDLDTYIRATVNTWYHPVGTCRMGADAASVVDTRLRVRGLENVSVVDASIFPEITSANTNAPTMMVAHRAAEWLVG